MERLLKDYLVEHSDDKGTCYLMTCTVCGSVWQSEWMQGEDDPAGVSRESAAREAAEHNCVCPFCGRPVCGRCFEDVEGISLCVQCANKLRERLETQ